ncbi:MULTISPECIES: transglutaminase-like cysteine peptidase [unclassified Chelatococcus]|uniref:transglutaminase-like cysteine peptidase n=1 Tax=unclassified Chelatococcus TaxID=2638111 RepID=UPI001BCE8A39|nr:MULTISPECIES: transglutaminase-like cysteine peptidase [unclassified Chelatococcus]CAH1668628.1 putative transglutaminase-like cysteine proteinase [Hyphomicrobiales bacterium]MBS7738101.1 transglutaminase-like cysteine peptidase [Chelatococcus sp. HY11]MBX3546952.1 transglutaminase-like cysteine peptidase [Chelatococcus sp.]MCO5077553.1 transglutaminase-like cysteine peptidase [Chelatococcus sp.]CAH1679142.1 putative transglutaminase-like cysteine proteinase [Hyphomicrobiales bacterium]
MIRILDRAKSRSLQLPVAAMLASLISQPALPIERHASLPSASNPAPTTDETRAPVGWIDFCKRHPSECTTDRAEPAKIMLSQARWSEIAAINRRINAAIRPMPDIQHWGLVESWDFPDDGVGDCEDYVLEKRKQLVAAGLPRRALLITVVLDEANAGHAVLMVRTDRGDFVLDNKRDAILPWSATGYRFIKRESQGETGWVAFGAQEGNAATATLPPSN